MCIWVYVQCKELYSVGCLFIGRESSCAKFVLKYMPRKGPLSFILESFNRRVYYISKRKECVLVFNSENSLLNGVCI